MRCSNCVRLVSALFSFFFKSLDWITPLADLIARCWIGAAFLKTGLLKLEDWQSTLMLFTYEFHVPLLSPHIAAILGTTMEISLPILVILGLGSRLVIVLLFLFNLIAAISYPALWTADGLPGLMQHVNWGIILLLLMCHGSGKLSLDNLIHHVYTHYGKRINQT